MRTAVSLFLLAAQTALLAAADPVVLENQVLRVEISTAAGRIRVLEKSGNHLWDQPAPVSAASKSAVYRVLRQSATSLEAERTFPAGKDQSLALRVRFTLPDSGVPDLRIEASADAPDRAFETLRFLEPFVLDAPAGALAVADYGNGHLYPLDLDPLPRGSFGGDRLDMPWVGMCDLDSGAGYLLLLETSDDSEIRLPKVPGKGGRSLSAPQVTWRPQKGVFGPSRSLLYHFSAKGGYVALCKRYRSYAQEHGLLLPFTEKLKKNPNLQRLFGAPDVWGNASLSFAREAKAAGVEKMILHGRPATPADMRAVNDLGYLTSEYDNYTDILEAKDGKVDHDHARLPGDAVLKSDQQRMTAWLTWDKKTQYMKRCPMLWEEAAKATADKVLAEWPFVGRFIDVTTAESMYECYDPKHPMTRSQKRECGPVLHRVFRDRGLVMGGEHGIWWCVPWVDYLEGMQSGGFASWPAGHLIHPKSKDEQFEGAWGKVNTKWAEYEKWGIGHEARVPLWELVFHDCIVSTWYWGDASDWLLDAAPEITPKKDACNILYGTIPLLWADKGGSWIKDREVFLRTYRNTCKLHEAVAKSELISHEWVTPDRAVQRTRFSDGTVCLVNFGHTPYHTEAEGKACVLPQNGWLVTGPTVKQSLLLENGKLVTTILAPGYAYCDRESVPLNLTAVPGTGLRIHVGAPTTRVRLRPQNVIPSARVAGALLYRCDAQGLPLDAVEFANAGPDELEFGPVPTPSSFLFLPAGTPNQADLRVGQFRVGPAAPRQGAKLHLSALISPLGSAGGKVAVEFRVDDKPLNRQEVLVGPGTNLAVACDLDTMALDGYRRVAVVVDPENAVQELSEWNNRVEECLEIAPDWSHWPVRKLLRVSGNGVARSNEPVVTPFALPAGADPHSLRMAEADAHGQAGKPIPAQLDGSELCFLMIGMLPADASRDFVVLCREKKAIPASLPPGGSFWHPAQQAALAPGYEARFENGTLTFLAIRQDGKTGANFLRNLVLSSKETGWTSEDGRVEEFETSVSGPVRTIVRVRKSLNDGVIYDKQYAFYPDRFDVDIRLNKFAGGLYSRANYLERATFSDNRGNTAIVDGEGDAENVYGRSSRPQWYAVFAPGWAHSCVALTPVDSLAYWDAGSAWGSVGFHTHPQQSGSRFSYVLHPGASDPGFAAEDYRKLTTPPSITWK